MLLRGSDIERIASWMSLPDFRAYGCILRGLESIGDDILTLYAQPMNSKYYVVSWGEIDWRALPHANSGRGSCRDDVARLQAHVVTQI
jgi:hypothetical protein